MADLEGLPEEQVKAVSPRWYRQNASAQDCDNWLRVIQWVRGEAERIEASMQKSEPSAGKPQSGPGPV